VLKGTARVQAVAALQANASNFGIASIYYKGNGIEMFGDPTVDIRVPDIAIKVQPGECVAQRGPLHGMLAGVSASIDGAGDGEASHQAASTMRCTVGIIACDCPSM